MSYCVELNNNASKIYEILQRALQNALCTNQAQIGNSYDNYCYYLSIKNSKKIPAKN